MTNINNLTRSRVGSQCAGRVPTPIRTARLQCVMQPFTSLALNSLGIRHNVQCRSHSLETSEESTERRLRESLEVDNRVEWCESVEELQQQLKDAGTKLVVLEIQSETTCEAGFDAKPDLNWKLDQREAERKSMEACSKIKHTFSRTARECTDVVFLEMMIPDGQYGDTIKQELGVELVPAIQFYREGQRLWQQQGFAGLEKDMGEGVLYYGNTAGGGVRATEYVQDLTSKQQLDTFVGRGEDQTLMVVNVSTTLCGPCIKVYPAVLALAKNFIGHVSFGRLMGDESEETEQLMMDLNIIEVPTFIFYRGGKEVSRHVGSSRGDLIGNILQLQSAAGLGVPPPPPKVKAPRVKKPAARRW